MSARRRRIVFTVNSRQDLSDILLYTAQQWGRAQRDTYRTLIRNTLRTLAQTPELGRSRDELSAGLRSHAVGSHVIFYWTNDREIVIAHIFHSRRDIERFEWLMPVDDTS
jgi:toxin ParE1/3/4